jgi:hypothetical protein
MEPLLEVDHGGVAGTTLRAHVVRAPGTFNHGRDGARHAQIPVGDHRIGLGHAFVHPRRHVVEELAVAALDEHLGHGLGLRCLFGELLRFVRRDAEPWRRWRFARVRHT